MSLRLNLFGPDYRLVFLFDAKIHQQMPSVFISRMRRSDLGKQPTFAPLTKERGTEMSTQHPAK